MATDDQAFADFVRARASALLRTAFLLTGDRGHAEDLVQTALANCYVAWGRIREPAAAEAYVRRTMVTTVTSWWRRKSWRAESPTADLGHPGVPDRADEVDERTRIWAVVCTLPARQRAVVVLRFYEDLSEAETARLLECSPGTVKSHTSRAMATLRRRLGEDVAPDHESRRV